MRTDRRSQSVDEGGNSGNGMVNSNSCRRQLSVENEVPMLKMSLAGY